MTLAFNLSIVVIKSLTRILCRVDTSSLDQVPKEGPLIIVANHINFLDGPVMYTHLQPRLMTGYAKSESWDNPFLGQLFNLWGMIPLKRGEADTTALREGIKALKGGYLLAITPEGTRSGDGVLTQGHPGMVTLALRSGSPLLPLAYFGHEDFQQNFRRLRRTDFNIRLGKPFHIDTHGERVTREVRQQTTDEIMYQVAALMPEQYRGYYEDLDAATSDYLRF
jgi:1-acyl-sn-glycerol-3-phosphate acyltransferase